MRTQRDRQRPHEIVIPGGDLCHFRHRRPNARRLRRIQLHRAQLVAHFVEQLGLHQPIEDVDLGRPLPLRHQAELSAQFDDIDARSTNLKTMGPLGNDGRDESEFHG